MGDEGLGLGWDRVFGFRVSHLHRYLVQLLAVKVHAARHVSVMQQQPDDVLGAEVDVVKEHNSVGGPHLLRLQSRKL